MTPPQHPITFTDFITKKEVLQIVKGIVQYYDNKLTEMKVQLNECKIKQQQIANHDINCINGESHPTVKVNSRLGSGFNHSKMGGG